MPPYECSCAEDRNDETGEVYEIYCEGCAAKDGHCECACDCGQCLYTQTPCGYVPEGPCRLCDLRQEWEDSITAARTVPPIRIPSPSAWGECTPTPTPTPTLPPAEFCQPPEVGIEDLEAAARKIWHAGVDMANQWLEATNCRITWIEALQRGMAWAKKNK